MIATSAAFKSAVVADARKTLVRVAVNLIDPDIVYSSATSSGATIYSRPTQLYDGVRKSGKPHATTEHNRWTLNGTYAIGAVAADEQVGFEGSALSDETGAISAWVQENFSGVDVLQACSIFFPTNEDDGYPVDFTVDIYSGGSVEYSESFAGNSAQFVRLTGFTVNNPDGIRITASKMSLPSRRLRVLEIIAGYYEMWENDDLAAFAITNKTDFAGLSVPYGTCALTIDNSEKLFAPRNKSGLFLSLEERQGIEAYIGFDGVEYVPVGTFYHYSGGWNTAASGLTMVWNMVDIIGLLASRKYPTSGTLPTTLEGWMQSIVSQLGANFASRYTLDGVDGTTAMTATAEDLGDVTCGQLLMWICQRACCWMKADAQTGKLLLTSTLPGSGNSYTLDNLSRYPVEKANTDAAGVEITLPDDTVISVASGNTASPNVISINNPFITTSAQAQATAAWILQFYGGNLIDTSGRGDPSSELGDLATVSFDDGETEQGRIQAQSFQIRDGVMRDCQSTMIEVSA